MAQQGRWVLKNLKHNQPGVKISGASLTYQNITRSIDEDILYGTHANNSFRTEWFTNLGDRLDLNAIINSANNPAEGEVITVGLKRYKVKWEFNQYPQDPPAPEPTITYRLSISPEYSCLAYNGVAQYFAILKKYVNGSYEVGSDVPATDLVEWNIKSGGEYVAQSGIEGIYFVITGNNTSDSTQTVEIEVKYNGQDYNVENPIVTITTCFNPEDIPVIGKIDIDPTSLQFECENNEKQTITVTVPEGVEWTATTTYNWIEISDITTAGTAGFKVTVTDNAGNRRQGTITVSPKVEGAATPETLSVVQLKCEEVPIGDITVDPDTLTIDCEPNGTSIVRVTAPEGITWSATTDDDWFTFEIDTVEDEIRFTFSKNDFTENYGTVSVYSDPEGAANPTSITLTQKACQEPENIEIKTNDFSISCDYEGPREISVTANTTWTAETVETWMHITSTDEDSIFVTFDGNAGDDDRSGIISAYTTGGGTRAWDSIKITQLKCGELPPVQETISIGTIADIPCNTDETYEILVNASTGWTAETNETWIRITGTDEDSIFVTFVENEGGDRTGVISAYTTEGGLMAWDSVEVTQLECEEPPIPDTFDVDDDDILFECYNDTYEIAVEASEGVTWTARTTDSDFEIKTGNTSFTNQVTGTGNGTVVVKSLAENRNVGTNVVYEDVIEFTSSLGDNKTIDIYQKPTPILEYTGGDTFTFDATGGSISISIVTNFDVNVSITQIGNWLSYTKGNLGSTADDGLVITFTAEQNAVAQEKTASIFITSNYQGECASPDGIELDAEQEAGEPYIPPTPNAYFTATDIYGDFPYYAELGGFTHEYSMMSDEFYEYCGENFDTSDIGGVVYLMPVRACAIQIYYDTNVPIENLTYEIEHLTPAQVSQEWCEVVMNPEEYGWSDVDSRDEPYPGDFIMIKTFDRFEGSTLYDNTYTANVHIKEKATGKVLCTIPVKCIGVDIRSESVKIAESEDGNKKSNITFGSENNPIIGAEGGFIDLWVYTNDSAYFNNHPDSDVNWDGIEFYYEDGETMIPVTQEMDDEGYIDKIYDTRCNDNQLIHIKVKVGPNMSFSNVEKGFALSTENAGYELLDGGNVAKVKIWQERNYERYGDFMFETFLAEVTGQTEEGDYEGLTAITITPDAQSLRPFVRVTANHWFTSNPENKQRVVVSDFIVNGETDPTKLLISTSLIGSQVDHAQINYGTGIDGHNPSAEYPFEIYVQRNTSAGGNGDPIEFDVNLTYSDHGVYETKTIHIKQNHGREPVPVLPMYVYVSTNRGGSGQASMTAETAEAYMSASEKYLDFSLIYNGNGTPKFHIDAGYYPECIHPDSYEWFEGEVEWEANNGSSSMNFHIRLLDAEHEDFKVLINAWLEGTSPQPRTDLEIDVTNL